MLLRFQSYPGTFLITLLVDMLEPFDHDIASKRDVLALQKCWR